MQITIEKLSSVLNSIFSNIRNLFSKPQDKFIYDLTKPLTTNTPVFPGDPPLKIDQIQHLQNGSFYNLFHLHLCNHLGTHIDFPAHVIEGGKTSENYTLQDLTGHGVIIEVPEQHNYGISDSFIEKQSIKKNDIVFFKTANSLLPENKLSDKYIYLTPKGANELIKKQIKMVGIDYISIDSLEDEKLPTHNKLLGSGILIVENLNLKDVPAGRYSDICVLPLNIPEVDGLPVRAFARNM